MRRIMYYFILSSIHKCLFCLIHNSSFPFLFYSPIAIYTQETVVDISNKFNEFVQIQRINGSLLCGGIIIDKGMVFFLVKNSIWYIESIKINNEFSAFIKEFVATAANCLHGHYAERHIKDIGIDGLKTIISEYKSPNGLGLVRFIPKYSGDVISTAAEVPEIGDSCHLLGWEIDVRI